MLCSAVCAGFSVFLDLGGVTTMGGSVTTLDCEGAASGIVAFGGGVKGDARASGDDVCAHASPRQTHNTTAINTAT